MVRVLQTGGYAAGMRIPAAYRAVWRAVSYTGNRPHGVTTVLYTVNRSYGGTCHMLSSMQLLWLLAIPGSSVPSQHCWLMLTQQPIQLQ